MSGPIRRNSHPGCRNAQASRAGSARDRTGAAEKDPELARISGSCDAGHVVWANPVIVHHVDLQPHDGDHRRSQYGAEYLGVHVTLLWLWFGCFSGTPPSASSYLAPSGKRGFCGGIGDCRFQSISRRTRSWFHLSAIHKAIATVEDRAKRSDCNRALGRRLADNESKRFETRP